MKSATIQNYLALTVTLIIYERNIYLNDFLLKTSSRQGKRIMK